MKAVAAHPIASPSWASTKGEVVAVESRLGDLRIEVSELGSTRKLVVQFAEAEAFRVMNERDLREFWPTCSSPNGWIFEVTEGGWLTQELDRVGSLIGKTAPGLREFLIAGVEDCVSVLARLEPKVLNIQATE